MSVEIVAPMLSIALDNCGIRARRTWHGWQFSSLKERFADWRVHAAVESWDQGQGAYRLWGVTAHFPGTAVRIKFASGSILLVFPSGHIRWMSELGFKYYAALSRGVPPSHSQGDLVVFELAGAGLLPHRHVLGDMLPEDYGTLWYKPPAVDPKPGGVWREVDELDVGGSARHRALGRLKYLIPVEKDHRTVQVQTLSRVFIYHDPLDHIHPGVYLAPDRYYLITKLPGFSDPVNEMKGCEEVSP